MEKKYKTTHPWLSFKLDMHRASPELWMLLGECQSKCEHIAGIPLRPQDNDYLHRVYLAKGVAATTAIEGNTLSEDQVRQRLEGTLTVPPSKEYLQQEVDNVIDGCNLILEEITQRQSAALTAERIKRLNAVVLNKLELENEKAVSGEFRDHPVGVGDYRGAPAEDCDYLVTELCSWLNSMKFQDDQRLVAAFLKAVIAHLYLAWIHPFGDGNGRTARLVEVQILLSSGVPSPAAQLLSNHYNETRSEYYRQLSRASKSGGDIMPFLVYALRGFRDGLRDQIEYIRRLQWRATWINYVHESFAGKKSPTDHRRKHLALALSEQQEPVKLEELTRLSPDQVEAYFGKTLRTVIRDVGELERMNLVIREGRKVRANKRIILAFLPPRAEFPKNGSNDMAA
jgi:Fic family protein